MPRINIITSSDDAATFAIRVADILISVPSTADPKMSIESEINITSLATTALASAAVASPTSPADLTVLLGQWNAENEVITFQMTRDLTQPINVPIGKLVDKVKEFYCTMGIDIKLDFGDNDDDESDRNSYNEEDEARTTDYPFKSWGNFVSALTASLQTEYFGEEYPKFQEALDEGLTSDVDEVKKFANSDNADEILESFVDIILGDGQRYGEQSDWQTIIKYLLRLGATFPIGTIMTFDTLMEDQDVEDILYSNSMYLRVELLDHFGPLISGLKLPKWIAAIEPAHYEEAENEDIEEKLIAHLKASSAWIRSSIEKKLIPSCRPYPSIACPVATATATTATTTE